jgi:hypothetical protein
LNTLKIERAALPAILIPEFPDEPKKLAMTRGAFEKPHPQRDNRRNLSSMRPSSKPCTGFVGGPAMIMRGPGKRLLLYALIYFLLCFAGLHIITPATKY